MRSNLFKYFTINPSIQWKMFAAFSIVFMFVLVATAMMIYYNLAGSIKENAEVYVTNSIIHAEKSLNTILQDVDHISSVVVVNEPNVIDILKSENYEVSYEWFLEKKKIESFLSSLKAYKSYIARITVLGVNGKIFYEGSPYLDQSILNSELVDQILGASGKRVFIKQNVEDTGGEPLITIGRAIRHNRTNIGVVMIDIKYSVVKNAFDIRPSNDSNIYVVNAQGKFVYNSNPRIHESNIKQTEWVSIFNQAQARHSEQPQQLSRGDDLIVSHLSDYTGWTTLGVIPQDTLFRDSIKLRNQIIQIILLVFVVVLFVSMAISMQISKNLKKLRNTMLWVQDGNLTVHSSIQSNDEVGQLYHVFKNMIDKLRNLMEDIKDKEKQKREAELYALQAQIRPHFLYNTLNTIKYLAGLQNAKNIDEVTTSLIELLRSVIGDTKEYVTLEEELNYIKSYINIQKYKFMNQFEVKYDVDPELLKCKVLKLILQPLVENSIFHGIAPLDRKGLIMIKVQKEMDRIRLEVRDNGVGMSDPSNSGGIGLANVHERLKMVYGQKYGIEIDSQLGMYTTVEIHIPFVKESD